MVRLVLFDIDGTLILSGGAGEKAFAHVCTTEFGIPDGTARLNFAGRTDTSIIREFFTQHQIEPSAQNFHRFLDHYVFHLDHLLGQLRGTVLPGVHAMLRNLEALPEPPVLGLLTGNIRLGAQIKLTHYHLWTCFQTGAFADDHEDRNQIAVIAHERGNQLLGRKLHGPEMLVIGDTPRDVECANAIGARSLAVATGKFSRDELLREKATWTVESLVDVSAREVCA